MGVHDNPVDQACAALVAAGQPRLATELLEWATITAVVAGESAAAAKRYQDELHAAMLAQLSRHALASYWRYREPVPLRDVLSRMGDMIP